MQYVLRKKYVFCKILAKSLLKNVRKVISTYQSQFPNFYDVKQHLIA